MGPVYAEIEIDAPREVIFDYLLDINTRARLFDGAIEDFRLLRLESRGVGAGARFRFKRRSAWNDTAITAVDRPSRISERGATGRLNRNRTGFEWEIAERPNGVSVVRLSYWIDPYGVYRYFQRLTGGSRWYGRQLHRALTNLRDLIEAEATATEQMAVAGGNRYRTGIL
jgi:uncharacterized protein YndB with AHSA1/START domain